MKCVPGCRYHDYHDRAVEALLMLGYITSKAELANAKAKGHWICRIHCIHHSGNKVAVYGSSTESNIGQHINKKWRTCKSIVVVFRLSRILYNNLHNIIIYIIITKIYRKVGWYENRLADLKKSRSTNQTLMSETSPMATNRLTMATNPTSLLPPENLLNQFNEAATNNQSNDIDINMNDNNTIIGSEDNRSQSHATITGITHLRYIPQCIRPNVKDFIDCSNIGRNNNTKRERTNKVRDKLNTR